LACAHLDYPPAKKVDQLDTYHGVSVPDPYRWLEQTDSPETRAWIEAQNRLTFGYLKSIPSRETLKARLTELWNYERYGTPMERGGRVFFQKNDGLQNQSVLYVIDSPGAAPRVLLDPNTASKDGTVSLRGMGFSHDGRLMAYSLSAAGSDWQEWWVRDVATGQDRPDHLRWSKSSGASWSADGKGFYYSRYDEPQKGEELKAANFFLKLYYHRLGTPQSEDTLVYDRPDQKTWGFSGAVSDDGRYLIIPVHRGSERKNMVFYKEGDQPVVELINTFEASYQFLGNDGPVFYFLTDHQAPLNRIIAIDSRTRERKELIPEAAETLQAADLVGDRFICKYLKDACSQIKVYRLDGSLERVVELPGLGTAMGFGGRPKDKRTFYSFSSTTHPPAVFEYDIASGKSTLFFQSKVKFDPEPYETRQIFYKSKDGTRIPMFLTHRKGLKLDGSHPTLLYGYGGFNISETPTFSVSRVLWLERGGVFAHANLRGGGEYGRTWHEAGTRLNKQNVFDDFIAAAEWLVANGYTRPGKLAIEGRSNGGLLVGACLTQRPDLFGAALPAVGVMDMLRFHKFTIGWAWTSDYGSSDNEAEFKALYKYSPYHNVRPGTVYPPTLITTADHDDRVFPAHSFKFAAALQAAQAGSGPILIRIETDAGHGSGTPTSKLLEETADRYAFLVSVLKMEER
jgi:prolyl oligopeptidase